MIEGNITLASHYLMDATGMATFGGVEVICGHNPLDPDANYDGVQVNLVPHSIASSLVLRSQTRNRDSRRAVETA